MIYNQFSGEVWHNDTNCSVRAFHCLSFLPSVGAVPPPPPVFSFSLYGKEKRTNNPKGKLSTYEEYPACNNYIGDFCSLCICPDDCWWAKFRNVHFASQFYGVYFFGLNNPESLKTELRMEYFLYIECGHICYYNVCSELFAAINICEVRKEVFVSSAH